MKNKKITLALLAVGAVSALAGCGKEKEEATISSVAFSGVSQAYKPSQTIDWTGFKVTVTYSDKTQKTISSSEIQFDVETASEGTQALVSTQGLHAMSTLTEGRYELSVKLKEENFASSRLMGGISVGEMLPSTHTLMTWTDPQVATKFKTNVAGTGKADEAKFKDTTQMFTVGTWNEFKFSPLATFMPKGGGAPVLSNSYAKKTSVKIVNNGAEVDASASDYEVTSEGFKFNDSLAGKVVKVSVSPADYEKAGGVNVQPSTFTVKVEKGFNIYNAKQLGILNLTSITRSENAGELYYGDRMGEDAQGAMVPNGLEEIFRDGSNAYKRLDLVELWEGFLKNTGTFTESEVANLRDVPGIYLQNDITIQAADIPQEFFFQNDEKGNPSNAITGSLRDESLIYNAPLNIERTINGNYFSLDASNIPLCRSNTSDDPFQGGVTGGLHAYVPGYPMMFAGHAALFNFNGIDHRTDGSFRENQILDEGTKQVHFVNLDTKGNTTASMTGDDDYEKMSKITGLIFAKSTLCESTVENCIIKEYMIGYNADHSLGQGNDTVSPKDAHVIKNSRIYDCSNAGMLNYKATVRIENSEMKRFGGAPVMNAGDSDSAYKGAYTNVTSNCVLENKITGEEVYFAALHATEEINKLKPMSDLTGPAGFPFVNEGLMNVLSISMDPDNGGYTMSNKRQYYARTALNCDTTPFSADLKNEQDWATQFYVIANQMLGSYLPIVQSSGSNHASAIVPQTIPAGALCPGNPVLAPASDLTPYLYYLSGWVIDNVVPEFSREPGLTGDYMILLAPVGSTTLNITFGR